MPAIGEHDPEDDDGALVGEDPAGECGTMSAANGRCAGGACRKRPAGGSSESPLGWTRDPPPGRFRRSGASATLGSRWPHRRSPAHPACARSLLTRRGDRRRGVRRARSGSWPSAESDEDATATSTRSGSRSSRSRPCRWSPGAPRPIAVFVFTALASIGAAAVAEPAGPPLGPTLALYWMVAASDESRDRTRLMAALVVGDARRARRGERARSRTASRRRSSSSACSSGAAPGWPATGRACAASGWPSSRSAPCAPSARPSASAAWRRPRSARGSPATCTTRPATRST